MNEDDPCIPPPHYIVDMSVIDQSVYDERGMFEMEDNRRTLREHANLQFRHFCAQWWLEEEQLSGTARRWTLMETVYERS